MNHSASCKLPYQENGKLSPMEFSSGSPGAIPALLAAISVFPDLKEQLLDVTSRAGETIW